jgi:hypothetical protein
MACEVDSREFTSQQGALLRFVQKITDDAQSVTRADIELLHVSDWTDLQIAEAIHKNRALCVFQSGCECVWAALARFACRVCKWHSPQNEPVSLWAETLTWSLNRRSRDAYLSAARTLPTECSMQRVQKQAELLGALWSHLDGLCHRGRNRTDGRGTPL